MDTYRFPKASWTAIEAVTISTNIGTEWAASSEYTNNKITFENTAERREYFDSAKCTTSGGDSVCYMWQPDWTDGS